MPETNVPIPAGVTPATVATYTDPSGNQRQVIVVGDPNLGNVAAVTTPGLPPGLADSAQVVAISPAPSSGELTVNDLYSELMLRELRRISAYLSLLTGEVIADDDIPELN